MFELTPLINYLFHGTLCHKSLDLACMMAETMDSEADSCSILTWSVCKHTTETLTVYPDIRKDE